MTEGNPRGTTEVSPCGMTGGNPRGPRPFPRSTLSFDVLEPPEIESLNMSSLGNPSMRRGIDHIGVGVGAIIVDSQGRLFLARRGPQSRNERGLWEFPGGSVEFGEKLETALRREMREEFGIDIRVGKLLDVVDHILPEEGQHWVSPSYLCTISSGEPSILEPYKCSEIGWFSTDAFPDDITRITRENLAHYRNHLADEPRTKD